MWRCVFLLAALLLSTGCGLRQIFSATEHPAPTRTVSSPRAGIPAAGTLAAVPTAIPTASPSPTVQPLPSPTATIIPTPEPYGCLLPVEDYTRVQINGHVLNRRTQAMLEHAAAVYGGELEITGYHITQGSYTSAEPASFGTHDAGGAVDLSVMRRNTYNVLWEDVEPLIAALRASGFAAWLREYGELYPGSPIHIHAVAIGDVELSIAASEQLTGPFGYFRGYTGVPVENGPPLPDRHGGPVICQWMLDAGFSDLRDDP